MSGTGHRAALLLVLGGSLTLLGCGSSESEELQQWMTQQRNQAQPKIGTVSEPKKYVPQAYTQERIVEPFNSQKLTQALRREAATAAIRAWWTRSCAVAKKRWKPFHWTPSRWWAAC